MPLSLAIICGAADNSQSARVMAAVMESWPQPAHSVDIRPRSRGRSGQAHSASGWGVATGFAIDGMVGLIAFAF